MEFVIQHKFVDNVQLEQAPLWPQALTLAGVSVLPDETAVVAVNVKYNDYMSYSTSLPIPPTPIRSTLTPF